MALRTTAAWLSALGLGLLVGCSAETVARTEIMVVIDSDLSVPSELNNLAITVEGPADKSQKSAALLGAGEPALPRSIGLVHEAGPLGPLAVLVEGRLGDRLVVSRRAKLSFVAGRTLLLPMHLAQSCRGVDCADDQTCSELGCVAVEIDSADLPDWNGEKPSLPDAAQMDAAVSDAGMDAAEPDASTPDASSQDASLGDASSRDAAADAAMCVMQVETCNMKDDDCNGVIDNGFNLRTNTNHCGMCNNRCQMNELCCSGTCRRTCQ